ncbi:MAG: hypothetical protein KAW88_04825, partial [Candidatus Cloacimonetes bacterium]|nr:hypothetical protein [Candidatus Cloacimonadota bacterium]
MFKKVSITAILLLIFINVFSQSETTTEPEISAKIIDNQIEVTYSIPEGYHQSLQKDYFYIETEEIKGVTFEPTIYPEGKKDIEGNIEYYGTVTLIKKFTIEDNFKDKIDQIKIYAGYQLCLDSGACLFPEEIEFDLNLTEKGESITQEKVTSTETIVKSKHKDNYDDLKVLLADFEITGKEAGYQKSGALLVFLEKSKEPDSYSSDKFANMNIWLIIILILIGGIALNLTPCVLPMIPITIAVLGAGTQSESKARGFLIGGTYGLGMALAYGLLGVIVILTGSQFGAINSSPWFNVIIAAIFIVLALAMFDIIPIDFSKFQSTKVGSKSRSKFITVFILG